MEKSDDIALEEKPSLGKSLSWARTSKELSQEEVAKELHLSKAIINALENDEPIEGVSPTYFRGYQRAYIRFLELDEQELLGQNISTPQFQGSHENLQIIDKDMSMRGSRSGFRFPFKLLIPLLLIGLAVIYWPQISSMFSRENVEQTSQAATNVQTETDSEVIQTFEIKPAEPINATTGAAEADSKEIEQSPEADSVGQVIVNQAETLTVEKIVDPTATANNEVAIATVEGNENTDESRIDSESEQIDELASATPQEAHSKITFIANGESWLDIKDAENTRLFRNILKLDQITVTGVLPLSIRTGNLQALRIRANQGEQQKVDVFDDSTIVANFLVEKDASGRLKFTAL